MTRLGIPLVCSSQGIDTSGGNPCGKFQLDVLKAVCEFERNLIRDRVNAGLAAARERGVKLGRPSKPHKRTAEVLALKAQGLGVRAIGRQLNELGWSAAALGWHALYSVDPRIDIPGLYRQIKREPPRGSFEVFGGGRSNHDL
jgi:hypothetical protein